MKTNKKPLSLRSVIFINICVSIVCCIVLIAAIFFNNMRRMVSQTEYEHMDEISDIVEAALTDTLYNLHSNTRTWSSWDEPYTYVLGENASFADDNLGNGAMLTLYKVDFVIIKDADGNDLFSSSRSEPEGEPRMEVPAGLSEYIADLCANVLAKQDTLEPTVEEGPYCDTGFVVYDGRSYMLCIMPILRSGESGQAVGTFTFIVNYDNEQFKHLTHLDNSTFRILSREETETLGSVDNHESKKEIVRSSDIVSLNSVIPNVGSDRSSILHISHPRTLYNNGLSLILATMFWLFFSIMIIMTFLYVFIRRSTLTPLTNLISDVGKIDNGEVIDTERYSRYEELYTLSSTINNMVQRMEQSHNAAEESKVSMNVLKNILNGLDAYLYVSDPLNGELLFINDKMKEHFDIEGDGIGQICWKVFQDDFTERCDFCPCYTLSKDDSVPVVWEEHNTVTNRYYRNTDCYIEWIGNRKVHLQHSVDITDIKVAQFALDRRLRQQALMTSISRSFILADSNTDVLIANALRMTGEFFEIAQVLFYRLDEELESFVCRNEWIDPALHLESRIGGKLPMNSALISPILGIMKHEHGQENGNYVSSNDLKIRELMAPYRVNFNKYITMPLFADGKIYGILDFSMENDGVDWADSDLNLAVLIANLLSGVFGKSLMEDQLLMLSSIVESSPQFILYLKADGKVDYINPASAAITGYTVAELKAGGLSLIFDDRTVRGLKEDYIPNTLKNGTDNFEIDLICKNGDKRIMAFSSFITNSGTSSVGGIAQDVTEIRKLEKELIAAKNLAEQGSRAKGEFLSRMSHEMRTPMNAIIGMTEIAKNSQDLEKKEYCLDRISNASRHLLGVINDILDMSKIEANKFELSNSEFNFERMLVNVFDVVNFRIEEKHQEFSIDIEPTIPAVLVGDEQHLAQVITNLLTNAVKFTPDGGKIQFKASLLGEEDDMLKLQIEVEDSGIGISKEQQSKLFHSFEQADGSIARKFGGTGLGLAISKRIVELMDGDIWIESELGKGSKFAFTLKVRKGEDILKNTLKNFVNISDLNIMFVDDSAETCDFFKYVMNEMGIPCTVVYGGAEALDLFINSSKPYDIIFTDWKMPGMNGIELTRELRKIPAKNPIIIMVSVAEWSDIKDEAIEAGVDDFLPKPLFPSLLMDCINKKLSMMAENSENENGRGSDLKTFEGKTALLAEDVDINREIILTVLEDTMLTIDCAENGREAVEMFSANPDKYGIIFMDVHMPEVDGLEATRRIRALPIPQAKQVPIVAMTANVFQEDIERCLNAGMNDHIGKPIDFEELFIKLKRYIK